MSQLFLSGRKFKRALFTGLCLSGVLTSAMATEPGVTAQSTNTHAAKTPPKAVAAVKKYSIEQFMDSTRMAGLAFSHDGKHIIFCSDANGVLNIYKMSVSDGKTQALTQTTADASRLVDRFYEDDRLLLRRDKGGNENFHIYVRETDGKETDLTPGGDKQIAHFAGWGEGGKVFYLAINDRDEKAFDLYRYDSKTYQRSKIYENTTGMMASGISEDGKWLVFNKAQTTSDSDLFLLELTTGSMKNITEHQGVAQNRYSSFDPESQTIYFTSNLGQEFSQLYRYTLASGKTELVEKADWDIQRTEYSRNGRYRITQINQDATSHIRLHDVKKNSTLQLASLPQGDIEHMEFSDNGKLMAFYLNSDRSPANLYIHDLTTGKSRAMTQSLAKAINPDDLVDAEVVRFKSFDGMVIPSIFYKPKHASSHNKVPAVVLVHGGPGGQTRRGYQPLIQYLVNHGYAVLGINNRGSSGYGKSFFQADDKKHGREPLWDCIEAKTWLASLGYIDHERIAIAGGSYGGYMTLAAMAFRPEAFKVGIDIFGVSNWLRTLESMPASWGPRRQALYDEVGDPVKDKERLIATSPLFHAKEIRQPLLVIQGANDPRVLKVESDEIVAAVKTNNVTVEYLVFDDEGHGFSKKKNQAAANQKILEFLDTHMKK